jgi:GT2 family glycosyltransferase
MISIIIPFIRPDKVVRCCNAIIENSGMPRAEYEIVTEEDVDRIGAPKMVKRLVAKSKGQMICYLGDDTIPQKDFLKNALEAMETLPDGWGLVGLDDNIRLKGTVKAAAHWLADKRLLPFLDGEFFHTGYKHCWCDNELTVRATELGRYIFCEEAYIYHDHVIANPKNDDVHYRRAYSQDWQIHDCVLFRKRRANGWQ